MPDALYNIRVIECNRNNKCMKSNKYTRRSQLSKLINFYFELDLVCICLSRFYQNNLITL